MGMEYQTTRAQAASVKTSGQGLNAIIVRSTWCAAMGRDHRNRAILVFALPKLRGKEASVMCVDWCVSTVCHSRIARSANVLETGEERAVTSAKRGASMAHQTQCA